MQQSHSKPKLNVGDKVSIFEVVEHEGVQVCSGFPSHYYKLKCTNCGQVRSWTQGHITDVKKNNRTCLSCKGMAQGQTGFNQLFRDYGNAAKKKKRRFDLCADKFKELTSSPCYYCGLPPSQRRGRNKPAHGYYAFNGLDRKNPDLDYSAENCLPCCWICNRAKGNMTFDEFV